VTSSPFIVCRIFRETLQLLLLPVKSYVFRPHWQLCPTVQRGGLVAWRAASFTDADLAGGCRPPLLLH